VISNILQFYRNRVVHNLHKFFSKSFFARVLKFVLSSMSSMNTLEAMEIARIVASDESLLREDVSTLLQVSVMDDVTLLIVQHRTRSLSSRLPVYRMSDRKVDQCVNLDAMDRPRECNR